MKETARVAVINGAVADVVCDEADGCKSCAGNAFCGVRTRRFEARVPERLRGSVAEGDRVEVLIPPGKTILAGFVVLMVPLLLFIGGFAAGRLILPEAGEGIQALFALAGLASGFLLAFGYNRLTGKKNLPVLTSVIPDGQR